MYIIIFLYYTTFLLLATVYGSTLKTVIKRRYVCECKSKKDYFLDHFIQFRMFST